MTAAIFLLIFFCISLIVAAFVLLFIFWIFMLIDCVKRDFKNENDKVVWVLLIVFLSWLGAILYYFIIKRSNKK